MTLENMKHFEEVLPTALFVRTHRSYIVSVPKIDYIERNRVVIGKERLPISEGYRKGVMGRLKG
jgi:DNA-binding LytR/AlgR family response regulator